MTDRIPPIQRRHVLAALAEIERDGVPANRKATRFALRHEGKLFPPKYVLGLAAGAAIGRALRPEDFSGGAETNRRLEALGFEVVPLDEKAVVTPPGRSRDTRTALPTAPTRSPRPIPETSSSRSPGVDGTAGLRVALVVPDATVRHPGKFDERALRRAIKADLVDLVAFPENHLSASSADAPRKVADLADDLGVPVLCGVWADDSYQACWYANPKPRPGETRQHRYFKHSTSVKLAYEWPGYRRHRDELFEPIALGGTKLGVHLCHDMYFGLVPARLVARGANALIDLTGTNVNLSKWRNVARGRSIEHQLPFLCTMSWKDGLSGGAAAFGYSNGNVLPAQAGSTDAGPGGFTIIATGSPGTPDEDAGEAQAYSPNDYRDVRIALGARVPSADICVVKEGSQLVVEGRRPQARAPKGWRSFSSTAGSVGVLPLPVSALRDPRAIYRVEPLQRDLDHHIVVYGGAGDDMSQDHVVALLRLRAIEHRMACGYVGRHGTEMIRTNRYKNIQRFRAKNGVYGLDASWMSGTFASSSPGQVMGIRPEFVPDYLALME